MSLETGPERFSDPAEIKQQFPVLAREGLHYLDSAATAQMPVAVIDALHRFGTTMRANVYGGVYKLARDALAEYEGARVDVARFIGAASPRGVVFTSGTTSALNLLAQSFGERLREGDEIVLSILEHQSNTLPWRALAKRRGVVSFTVSGLASEAVCRRLDEFGLALRHGHHCAQPLMMTLGIEGTARASSALHDRGGHRQARRRRRRTRAMKAIEKRRRPCHNIRFLSFR
jgi:selenocysteine lyase/cysteine desulfurase